VALVGAGERKHHFCRVLEQQFRRRRVYINKEGQK
jgi:hypothetical protein